MSGRRYGGVGAQATDDGGWAGALRTIQQRGRLRQERMVQRFGLALWLLNWLAVPINVALTGDPAFYREPLLILTLLVGAAGLGALLLARAGQPTSGALLFVNALAVAIVGAVHLSPETDVAAGIPFAFLVALATAGFVLTPRWVAAYTVLFVVLVAAFTATAGYPVALAATAALLIIMTGSVMAAYAQERRADEQVIKAQGAALQRHGDEVEAVLGAVPDALLLIDEGARIVAWNQAAAAWIEAESGQTPRKRRPVLAYVPRPVQAQVARALDTAYRDGRTEQTLTRDEGGQQRKYHLVLHRIHRDQGGIVASARDVTEEARRTEEAHLQRLQGLRLENLRAMQTFRGRLVATAANELNTPLTPIRLQLDLLRRVRYGSLSERQARSIAVMDRNVRRLEGLVRALLDVTRVQDREVRIRKEPVEVDDLLRDLADMARPRLEHERIRLHTDLRSDAWIDGDPARIMQAVENLIQNAVEAEAHHVSIESAPVGDQVVIRVIHDGAGFDPEEAERLFEPFSPVAEGPGVGLFIAKGLVEAHGGRLLAKSEGKGAVFTVALPIPDGARTAAAGPEARVG